MAPQANFEREGSTTLESAQRGRTTREIVRLEDFTDCLLQAYDGVARRAYQKFVGRGSRPGGELDDWLAAEQELGRNLVVDVSESEKFLHATAGLSRVRNGEISVAMEGRWLMVLGSREFSSADAPESAFDGIEWNSAIGTAVAIQPARRADGESCSCGEACGGDCERLLDKAIDDKERLRLGWGSQPFCVLGLPSDVDRDGSSAVLADGILAIRMKKCEVGHEVVERPERSA